MKNIITLLSIFCLAIPLACSDEDPVDTSEGSPMDDSELITIDPTQTHQTMIGFGGSLSWYCDRITSSSKKNEIIDVIVNDLGLDILRLKNWYYPVNYPENKTPDEMEIDWFVYHFEATNELYDLVKNENPDIKVLFSSWGPPSALKSNSQLDHGTLKKQDGEFMYDAYANYWEDVLNHITFVPDYLSIQNEPTWVADWETCEWRSRETSNFPGYEIAFDKVADKLSLQENPPILIGPESANLSYNGFDAFATDLRDNPNLTVYAYHPYNFNDNSSLSQMQSVLSGLGSNFTNKPNIMTEYSGLEWMKTARFINSTLREANTSAYLYWTLMWAETGEDAMIKVDNGGNYELTKFYYLMKHFAKYIDEGYVRLDVSSEDESLDQVGFMNPAGNELTIISINPSEENAKVKFEIDGKTITQINSYQSTENQHFITINTENGKALSLKEMSITTTILKF